MRVLGALRILEDATVECKMRNIDTAAVKEALDLLDPYCRPHGLSKGFAIICGRTRVNLDQSSRVSKRISALISVESTPT